MRNEWFLQYVMVHHEDMRGFLRRRGWCAEVAEDLCQDVYVRMLESEAAGSETNVRSFMLKTLQCFAMEVLRAQRIRKHADPGDLRDTAGRLPLDPEHWVCAQQELDAVVKAMEGALTPRQREVVWLKRAEGLTLRVIGERLNIAVHTVEQHMRAGLAALRRRVGR